MRFAAVLPAIVLVPMILLDSVSSHAATERYHVDVDHSIVGFAVAHMMVAKTMGRFTDFTGFIEMDPEASTVKTIEAVIKTASVNIHVEKYPTMPYRLKSYCKVGNQYTAKGDLTLLGVTKEIELTGTFNGLLPKDPHGLIRAGFSAQGKINRKDFGMVWNRLLDNGGVAVGDEVEIRLEIECIKQP